MMSTQATAMIYLTWIAAMPTVAAFSASNFPRKVQHLTQAASSYGRGAEIWPECNENQVSLSDSFPGGIVPSQVAKSLTFGRDYVSDTNLEEISSNEPRTIRHVLSRITDTHSSNYDHVEKAHFLIMMFLLFNGLIGPQDIIVAAGLGGYLSVLYFWARSPRSDGFSPIVPKLPPQGHVPDLVHNPLGLSFTCSSAYNTWLKIGTFIGVLTPMLVIFKSTIFNSQVSQIGKASWCARPLFFFCCQSLIESRFRQRMAPLPLRILTPIAFNVARLPPLWNWTVSAVSIPGRIFAIVNLVYWSSNLFAFLIPIAAMRYMRTYFLCVEVEQVTIRPGFDNAVGLLP